MALATLYGLYEHDEERAYHTTVDDLVGVFNVVTLGLWILLGVGGPAASAADDLALPLLLGARGRSRHGSRGLARTCAAQPRLPAEHLVVGAGEVGQLVARKLLQAPGVRDERRRVRRHGAAERHPTLADLPVLGAPGQLDAIVRQNDIERVVVAFSRGPPRRPCELVRSLKDHERADRHRAAALRGSSGPNVDIHTIEGVPVIGLPQARLSRRRRAVKRAIDVIGASPARRDGAALRVIAARIKRDSAGPIFFRQNRLTANSASSRSSSSAR